MEELGEVCDFVVDDLFVINVVIGLKVDARVRHKQDALYLHQWQNLLHMELVLELRQL